MNLAQRLVNMRQKKKLTQKELAGLVNISRSALSLYEIGKRDPDYETLLRLADFFEVTTDYLLGRTNNPSLPQNQDPPDFDAMVLAAPDLGEAIKISIILRDEYNLSQKWLYGMWDKATAKFGVPPMVEDSEPAAHTRNIPGTGIKLDE